MVVNKLFVYGTLKKGRSNHETFLSNAKFEGVAKTTKSIWGLMDLGAYPAMTYGTMQVEGEMYSVTDLEMARIDRLEGLEWGLYERDMIHVDVDDVTYDCYAYFMLDAVTRAGASDTLKAVW